MKFDLRARTRATLQTTKKRWKIIALAVVLLGGVGWYFLQANANGEQTQTFINPQRTDITQTLQVSGVVDAKEKARMRFAAGGKVVYLGAQVGDWVNKWQTIATIDRATLQKQLQQDLNSYLSERWDWENTQDDIKDRVLDTQERRGVDQEQFRLNNAVLNVEIRDIAIRNTGLYAPFAGVLTQSPTNVTGVTLLASDFFELVNPDTLIFLAAVDEIDISKVAIDQPAAIVLDAYEEETIETTINYIAYTSSESSSGTVFLIEMKLPSADLQKYRIGMNGDVDILLTQKSDVLVIPLAATRERDGKVFVDVRTGETAVEEREIVVGLETEEEVEVVSGLSASDAVLLPGQ